MLAAEKLYRNYRGKPAVADLSLQVERGEIVGLLGPNGAGKTTTFYLLMGWLRPDGGRVCLNGTDITGLPMYRRARAGLGYLPQEPSVFGKLTVAENLLAVLEFRRLPGAERRERCAAALEKLNLTGLTGRVAGTLSGGERRRVEVRGIGVLITDHNVRETLAITDRSYLIFQGRVLISGSGRELVDSPEARRLYLGESFSL
ncbi:MAG: Lipopolysaccharide export system ATP-binding protein LptB [candidate division TA06 bacterium ADurb.Bin417]|uniref:Lipopolysaccharide export system ATP-binding protein LptB n=1 Tax=candidate division TA06 bacterium ADurb.Bin417 TaxID=1852828 RepID=A0A1V5MII2_UNCT6|nr:MAG: Lipopolysaccharide export system ATP-binding protein LptB [candidate division TA06 bacterium ADurb.Bin417]